MAASSNAQELHTASSNGAWQPKAATIAEEWGSPSLRLLADRLRHYRAPASQWMSHTEDDAHRGVNSSMGMPTSIADANDIKWSPNQKRAAVLLCLFQGAGGELRVILTKRAGSLSSHSGEVALPGGKKDEGDEDDKATALREAQEEIGLEPSHVKIVTVLEPFLSKHLLTVTPVVAILPEHHKFEPRPNAGEVDAIFDVPLEMFLKDERHRFEDRQWLEVKYRVHYFEFEAADRKQFTIWGLTASILIRAASIILQRPADFPEFSPDFDTLAKQAMHGKDHKM
jgi:8-oxo-dGTP pyrophosphatase MutT (NUDIX family)